MRRLARTIFTGGMAIAVGSTPLNDIAAGISETTFVSADALLRELQQRLQVRAQRLESV
jgi:hypothetical protein